jgi:hypothetical protein
MMRRESPYGFASVLIILIIANRLFSFTLIDDKVFDYMEILVSAILIAVVVVAGRSKYRKQMLFAPFVNIIIFLTLLSAVPAYFFHDQSFGLSVLASRTIFFWLLYYFLHKTSIRKAKLERLLMGLGLLWCSISVFQQFSYPLILFNDLRDQLSSQIQSDVDRGGLLRIYVSGEAFGIFVVFYSWRKIQEKINVKFLIFLVFGIAGIFLTGSRQVVFSVILIIIVDTFFSTRASNLASNKFIIVILTVFLGVYFFAFEYLAKLIELSLKQKVSSKDYIRNLEINFFLFGYWPHWLTFFLGNGWEHMTSPYGKNVDFIKDVMRFYRSDIGLIGALNKFGLFYCITALSLYYKVIIPRSKIRVPGYIRLIFIYFLLTSFSAGNHFERGAVYGCLICLLYIIDITNGNNFNHNSNPQQIRGNQEGAGFAKQSIG